MTNPGPRWAGLDLATPRVMGILNVTPDSFSDGGRHGATDAAITAGFKMVEEGADIVDVGGESTRPGADPIPPEAEQARILPVIRELAAGSVLVSVDTRHAATMAAALDAGAAIVNDVSGLAHDPDAAAVVASHDCPVVIMHMRGTPATMNALAEYRDVVAEVRAELRARLNAAMAAGIRAERIMVDPGLGFAKTAEQSVALLRDLRAAVPPALPILVGLSRKRFIGMLSAEARADRRLGGSLAAGLFALSRGASVLRVHDVRETVQGVRVWHALSM
ncbi:dihydropteroate synthase [Rhodopila sp.]|uniref:dihydropteroate synthase n=1 Tax=Rhodopila sp. TaxID=2480087 RepID=UPI002C60A646|nr:dihydropteroate synthase [Rhodopila sp.]HVZ06774.1 dihydropteroate synthase [Rhodopila sp.]